MQPSRIPWVQNVLSGMGGKMHQLSIFEPEFVRDIDCTKDTPVKLGNPSEAIYGKGISITPRLPGRKDTDHMKKVFLPELLPLEEYDLIVVLLSGGKDSIASYFKLIELGVPKSRIEFWHHDSMTRS